MDHAADKPKIKRGDSMKRLSTHGIRGAGAVAKAGGESKASRKGKKTASQDPCILSGTVLTNICQVAEFNYTTYSI